MRFYRGASFFFSLLAAVQPWRRFPSCVGGGPQQRVASRRGGASNCPCQAFHRWTVAGRLASRPRACPSPTSAPISLPVLSPPVLPPPSTRPLPLLPFFLFACRPCVAGATPQAGGAPPTRDPPLAMRRRPWRMVLSPAFPAWWGPPPPLRLLADVAARAGWSVARPRPRPLPPSFVLSSDTGRRSPWRWHPCMWATGSSVGGLSSTLWP